ncbi:MAG: hypothetical protein RIM23_06945 [Coleofasciculus sp. G3-WIS-01]
MPSYRQLLLPILGETRSHNRQILHHRLDKFGTEKIVTYGVNDE